MMYWKAERNRLENPLAKSLLNVYYSEIGRLSSKDPKSRVACGKKGSWMWKQISMLNVKIDAICEKNTLNGKKIGSLKTFWL